MVPSMVLSQKEKVEAVGLEKGREEINKIKKLCKKLIADIGIYDEKEFPKLVGFYARRMPKFLAFSEEGERIVQIIRMVCTIEMSKKDAVSNLTEMVKELEETEKELQV